MSSTAARPVTAGRAAVPAALALLCALAAAGALVLVGTAGLWQVAAARELPVDTAIAVSYSAAGVLVLLGRGGRRMGWLLLAVGVAGAGAALGAALGVVAHGPAPWATAAVFVQSWVWVPGFLPLMTLVPLLYPDGRLPGWRWWPVAAAAVVGMVLLAVGAATYPETFEGRVALAKPWTSQALSAAVFPVGGLLSAVACAGALAAVAVRWRRADALGRRQITVLLVVAAVLVADTVLQSRLPWPVGSLSQAVAVALVPLAIGVAVTRHRLYDLDLAVCRAIGGASLAVSLAGIYLSLFLVAAALLPGSPAVGAAAAAAVCGVLLHPLGVRLNRGVDRMFYGDRAEPARVLEAVAVTLRAGVDGLPERVCDVVVDSLRLGSAALLLGDGEAAHEVARRSGPAGARDTDEVSFPMHHRGEPVGALRVCQRPGESRLSERDAALLALVCDQVAPAVAALRLADRLQQSRAALVTAREEERRRLRRDLHDGVGAALAGVRLQVETAQDLTRDDVVERLLRTAASGVATAVDDLRTITDDLRPAALDDLGLAAAVRGLAERTAAPGLTVATDVHLDASLPAAVEVAGYRIVAEALANAVRHSGARQVTVRVAGTARGLDLEVADDGHGMPALRRAGALGLDSMRQRAEEIGGTLTITSGPGGTRVAAALPTEAR
ncbi:MAG TPA: sensor histidine kinase [Nocardioides sp.]|uniref:sensor histidine kinase n=1 Tax=Nocardioides sp. TaxID=35761 RepID=UPI002ED793DE